DGVHVEIRSGGHVSRHRPDDRQVRVIRTETQLHGLTRPRHVRTRIGVDLVHRNLSLYRDPSHWWSPIPLCSRFIGYPHCERSNLRGRERLTTDKHPPIRTATQHTYGTAREDTMIWWHAVVIVVAGFWAGTINTVVGSGTLVTFPTLLALGYPPVTATTSNAIGLAPGSVTGAIGYRHELRGLRSRLLRYATASALGAGCGTVLLLGLPRDAFATVVPFLIVLALVLVLVQPKVSRWVANRNPDSAAGGGALLLFFVFLIGVYGGYFSAAQGVLLMGV